MFIAERLSVRHIIVWAWQVLVMAQSEVVYVCIYVCMYVCMYVRNRFTGEVYEFAYATAMSALHSERRAVD